MHQPCAGQFQDNQFHGQGVHVFPDGEFYDGDWHSGVIHTYAIEQTLFLTVGLHAHTDRRRDGHGVD